MQHKLDFYDNHDGDEFIQYKKCKPEHKMPSASVYHMAYTSITHNILALVSIVVSDAWL